MLLDLAIALAGASLLVIVVEWPFDKLRYALRRKLAPNS